jgi:two-component system response regulator
MNVAERTYGMKARFVLLVEDNPDDELLSLRALKKSNITNDVTVVRDGVEALDFLFCRGAYAGRDPEHKPELVLLDLRLPKMDGIEVLRQLRGDDRTRSLPVIVLTGSGRDRDMVDSVTYGAHAYMRKPIDFDQFVAAARELGLQFVILKDDLANEESS